MSSFATFATVFHIIRSRLPAPTSPTAAAAAAPPLPLSPVSHSALPFAIRCATTAATPSSESRREIVGFAQSGHLCSAIDHVLVVLAQSSTTSAHNVSCFSRVTATGCSVKNGGNDQHSGGVNDPSSSAATSAPPEEPKGLNIALLTSVSGRVVEGRAKLSDEALII
eukprot:CAMPEP_0182574728 /NCGR_PEP_ID=MMETSP1324-20130603/27082_1 /TAXON_ID=236786 /ORGANISM="Florenciella sp., Strain RCC1587" /LENGTH=166 /DNA_ID=CAMNT_0024790187 /DNA_START=42 /DNA_END=539 /DNA_ORIENTATION=-